MTLLVAPVWAQQEVPANNPREEILVVPAAVLRAPVRVEQVVKGGAENGGDLIIQRIETPVPTAGELGAMQPVPVRELTPLEKASRLEAMAIAKSKAPLEIRLFSPSVVQFPDNVSKISWWSMDLHGSFEDHEVWVSGVDMSLLPAVGDLTVGRRRWLLTAIARQASGKWIPHQTPPTAADFVAKTGDAIGPVVLVEKGGDDSSVLEPLIALLAELKNNAPHLEQNLSAMKSEEERQAAEAAAKAKLPPPPSIIRFWTSDHDEVGTFSRNMDEAGRK